MSEQPARDQEQSLPEGELRFLRGVIRAPAPERLPRGHHDLSPEYVAEHQRVRILEATTNAVAEIGYADSTVGQIVKRARVSRRTFYEHFDSKEHAFLAAFGASVECLAAAVQDAYGAGARAWEERIADALAEFARQMVDWPNTFTLCFVEVGAAGAEAEARRADGMAMCADALRRVCTERGPEATAPDAVTGELAVGGMFELVRARMAARDPEAVTRELPSVARALLAPLVGEDVAGQVAAHVADRVEPAEAAPRRAAHT
jgi:AcrR family transcriptional regulator